ncbi:related to Ribosomal RNA-processing protein 17 [Zygosaccharomyces bailii]|nr:related to Ribosomal RNA-processing protein 17 [Zygosaccharomyces bailii]
MGRTNRQILSRGKDYAARKAKQFGASEVEFNKDDRLQYLTGFHKRKLQRQKKAQEFNKEQERLARIEQRREMREERKKQMEENMNKFKKGLDLDIDDSEDEDEDFSGVEDGDKKEDHTAEQSELEDTEEWHGFDQKPILKSTYPEADVSIETLEPNDNLKFLAEVNNVKLAESDRILKQSISRAGKYAKFLGMEDKPQKPKKKKFRYLSKGERKVNQLKANKNKKRK